MPIVASMGGVAATQTLTIVLRGLTLEQINTSNIKWLLEKPLNMFMLKKANYKASVLVANYNNEKHLSQCVESILKQSYRNIENLDILTDDELRRIFLSVRSELNKKRRKKRAWHIYCFTPKR